MDWCVHLSTWCKNKAKQNKTLCIYNKCITIWQLFNIGDLFCHILLGKDAKNFYWGVCSLSSSHPPRKWGSSGTLLLLLCSSWISKNRNRIIFFSLFTLYCFVVDLCYATYIPHLPTYFFPASSTIRRHTIHSPLVLEVKVYSTHIWFVPVYLTDRQLTAECVPYFKQRRVFCSRLCPIFRNSPYAKIGQCWA